ncbi:MAG TPA: META domain-containing protein [Actinomycetota bacterium]|jgi:heat shock protein HslJ
MSRNRILIGVVVAVAAIVVAVVWVAADSGGGDGGTLAGTSWTLTGLDSGGVTGTAPTLELTETDVSGTGGCNTFSGTYTTDGDTISFGPLASTMMACEPSIMEQETVYLAALDGATTYTVDGDALTISGDAGTLSYAKA